MKFFEMTLRDAEGILYPPKEDFIREIILQDKMEESGMINKEHPSPTGRFFHCDCGLRSCVLEDKAWKGDYGFFEIHFPGE
ncbi:hypothetical protein AVEN_39271-1 [Araneus ventricosus]|uniref:Uncharacterized protein n=1 Tax=Araneus ventricosus TaxID=182803 RepID=A0A4Y2MYQ2_ARAVE|nr:hypothetical protein AVEN_39271-1 [Araneus ventricosus]